MKIRTKADLIKDLEMYSDDALIWIDEECARDEVGNYLFSITDSTAPKGYTDWDIILGDGEEEE